MKKRDFLKVSLLAAGAMMLPRKASALKFYPTKKDTDWAILYSTWCGSSRDAAVWISEGMNGIAEVFDVKENPDLSGYSHIVVGGSIRSAATSPQLQEYLKKHREQLAPKIKAYFAVCGNMMRPVTDQLYTQFFTDHLCKITGIVDVPQKVFLGRITWGLMEPEVREQMQSFPGMVEYDNLKRQDCLEFGKEIFESI
jgi:hypothetical protein